VSPRTAAEIDLLDRRLGVDLALDYGGPGGWWEDADLTVDRRPGRIAVPVDIATATGVPAAVQFLVDRLKTQKGELGALGHPEYGSRHHELIGQPNVQRTQNLIKVYVLEALKHEPRIEKILAAKVYATSSPPRDTVQIDLTVQLIGQPNPLNFVVPFSLEVGA
jgi:phage baseplate assembly protein W